MLDANQRGRDALRACSTRVPYTVRHGFHTQIAAALDVLLDAERRATMIDLAIEASLNEATRVLAELVKEVYSPKWYRMPVLIGQLRSTWDLGTVDIEIIGNVWATLDFMGQYDLMRDMAEAYASLDPPTPEAAASQE